MQSPRPPLRSPGTRNLCSCNVSVTEQIDALRASQAHTSRERNTHVNISFLSAPNSLLSALSADILRAFVCHNVSAVAGPPEVLIP
jgi:phosphatidylserine/phosphatidylglycerophosphate/cardiolipin synthase-like enzyme